jgi:UDP-N-acetylmuramoyl-L-alanyl-D-glutamate--2,6-diaminopimelate ligase
MIEDLLREVEDYRILGDSSPDVSALSYRSSDVGPGHLFFCVPGYVRDGHDFAPEAVERGASCLCVERELPLSVSQILVPSVRRAMGPVAAAFFGHPSRRLLTAGITGTNGKTTSAFLAAWLMEAAGVQAGFLGTIERRIGGFSEPAVRTTPEAPDTQRDLALMVERGDQALVMEVSSHALDLGRVRGIDFDVVAFTNLTQDHLDFHHDLESYFRAKSQLFFDPHFAHACPPALLNLDDGCVRRLSERLGPERVIGFTLEGPESRPCDLYARDIRLTSRGATFVMGIRGGLMRRVDGSHRVHEVEVESPLLGRFNVANTLTAVGIALLLGVDLEVARAALSTFPGVPGRMQEVDVGQPFTVVVDYAHTPDSVSGALQTLREVSRGAVIGVLGCGGDRDRGKRPKMGVALEQGADVAVLTSDNPRSESPESIIDDILRGLARPETVVVEPDRRTAIGKALSLARAGDIVAILGKGHETGQQCAAGTVPFDDRVVAAEELRRLAASVYPADARPERHRGAG